MSAENSYKVDEFSITPLSGGLQNIVLSNNSISSFEYYEDVLSPTVTAKLTFVVVDVKSFPQGFEIYGGEKINILITTDTSSNGLVLNDSIRNLYVRSVKVDKTSKSAIYELELVSKEVFTNETTRVVNRFDGKVSDSASSVFSQLKSQKNLVTESSANKYTFIGNVRRPFDLLMWLCPKSVPSGTGGFGTAGYLFFETQNGYKFESIDKLISQQSSVTYEQTENTKEFNPKSKYRILNSNVAKNNDILMSLRMGMYSNNSFFYNLYTNKTSTLKYSLKNSNIKRSSNSTNYPKLPEGIENYPSRYLVRTLDVGNMTDDPESIENLPKYQAEAAVRYNLLFSQILNITIPCNLDLRAGQVIDCKIPESTAVSTNKTFESQQSGKYMIANLCHKFKGNQCYTLLSLIRDSYELKAGFN
ncbi:MAG: hypothetical protein ACO25L_01255 [Candidatus Nanopelagicales bacterium]|nr:tail protein [Synechococcus phage DSL-LC03]